jgi:hypothetical protein
MIARDVYFETTNRQQKEVDGSDGRQKWQIAMRDSEGQN